MKSKRYRSYNKTNDNIKTKDRVNALKYAAFTLVEIAMVLAIGGVILAIAVKGKGLIETSRVTSDITKIRNMLYAVGTATTFEIEQLMYYPSPNPGYPTSSRYIDYGRIFRENGINPADLKLNYFQNIDMMQCMSYGGLLSSYSYVESYRSVEDVCLILRNPNPTMFYYTISPFPSCALDAKLDNGNLYTGNIRLWYASYPGDFRCPSNSNRDFTTVGAGVAIKIYSYLL